MALRAPRRVLPSLAVYRRSAVYRRAAATERLLRLLHSPRFVGTTRDFLAGSFEAELRGCIMCAEPRPLTAPAP